MCTLVECKCEIFDREVHPNTEQFATDEDTFTVERAHTFCIDQQLHCSTTVLRRQEMATPNSPYIRPSTQYAIRKHTHTHSVLHTFVVQPLTMETV